jgi:hypothetical protein
MTTVQDMINRLRQVDIESLTWASLEETRAAYVEAQVSQMNAGIRSDGAEITPQYAASTVARKKRKGQPSDHVTLRDTGEYHRKMSVSVDNEDLKINSDVEYEKYLDERYTSKIYGLESDRLESYTFGPFWGVLKQKLEEVTKLQFV